MHIYLAHARFVVVVCGLWCGRLVGRMHIYLARARFVVVGCGLCRGRLVGRMYIYLARAIPTSLCMARPVRDGYKVGE